MNRSILVSTIAATAATFSATAFAESPLAGVDTNPFVSSKSRAEVRAELNEYKRAGINPWSMSYNPLSTFKSRTSREAVTAAYLNARDEVAALNSEDSGSAYLAQAARGHAPNLEVARSQASLEAR